MSDQDPISCEENNPLANLNFNRSDYFIHFFTISPIPLMCLFSLYQAISAGAKSLEDIATWGLGLYFFLSWVLYPISYLAIQFMASRKLNLRKTSQQAASRISYKYFSILVGYLLAIPLSPIGFTTISHIKQYQALKAQAKAKQEAKETQDGQDTQEASNTTKEELSDANNQSPNLEAVNQKQDSIATQDEYQEQDTKFDETASLQAELKHTQTDK